MAEAGDDMKNRQSITMDLPSQILVANPAHVLLSRLKKKITLSKFYPDMKAGLKKIWIRDGQHFPTAL